MKTRLILITCLLFINYGFSLGQKNQKKEKKKETDTIKLDYDLKSPINSIEETLRKGSYSLTITGKVNPESYIKVKREETIGLYVELTPASNSKPSLLSQYLKDSINEIYTFDMKNRSEFKLTIQIFKKEDDSLEREIKIFYKSKNNKKWVTSVGISSAFLINNDTYRTVQQEDNSIYNIVRDGSNEIFNVMPLMQFSFINLENDNGFAPTAGIGLDNTNVSVFLGGSFFFGQNIYVTGGLALHKQKRLNNLYNENQELASAVDEAVLNTEYYRVNPFISLTYRLSTNIFNKN